MNQDRAGGIPTCDELREFVVEHRNWERWGLDDELGALNLVTNEKRVASARLIAEGSCFSLSRPYPEQPTLENPRPAQRYSSINVDPLSGRGSATDYLGMDYHGLAMTHLDALSHVWDDEGMWAGRDHHDVFDAGGASFGDIAKWRKGVLTRGVLLDVEGHRGKPVTPETPVHGHELERVAHRFGIDVGPGDAVIVHCGREASSREHRLWGAAGKFDGGPVIRAGLHPSVLVPLRRWDAAVLVWDMMDAMPSPCAGLPWSVHTAISAFGMALVDNALTQPLASACHERGRYEFALFLSPLPVIGGTGSPVNPICIL